MRLVFRLKPGVSVMIALSDRPALNSVSIFSERDEESKSTRLLRLSFAIFVPIKLRFATL